MVGSRLGEVIEFERFSVSEPTDYLFEVRYILKYEFGYILFCFRHYMNENGWFIMNIEWEENAALQND